MEHPEQAIKYLEKCIIFIFSNGSLVDQAKLHYLYAKCLHILDKKKSKPLKTWTLEVLQLIDNCPWVFKI